MEITDLIKESAERKERIINSQVWKTKAQTANKKFQHAYQEKPEAEN
jgi:hypothetical protein